jgi:hypothetical protein
MAAMTLYEAAKISRHPLSRGIMLGTTVTNQLISMFPWVPKSSTSFQYDREGTLASAEFVSPTHSSLTESSTTFDQVTVPMRLIDTDVDVYNHVENANDPNGSPRAIQLEKKLKATGLKIQQKMITGGYGTGFTVSGAAASPGLAVDAVTQGPHLDSDRYGPGSLKYTHTGTFWQFRAPGDRDYGPQVAIAADGSATLYSDNPSKWITVTIDVSDASADGECLIRFTSSTNEPDGLLKLIHPDQVIASSGASGDALSFDVLDQLYYEKLKVRDNPVYLMNSKLIRKFRALARTASGGMTPEQIAIPHMGMDGVMGSINVPQYNGIPILTVDDIPSTETKSVSTLSSVLLVSLSAEQGFWGGCQSIGSAQMVDADPRMARIMGFQLYEIGQLESKAATRDRIEWMGAFALGSTLAAARAKEIVTA